MRTAQLCPVCKGAGQVPSKARKGSKATKTCHGCDGNGWVEVGQGPYRPYCPPWRYPPYPYPRTPWYEHPRITWGVPTDTTTSGTGVIT